MQCAVNGCPYKVVRSGGNPNGTWVHEDTHGVMTGHAAVPKREPKLHEYSRQIGEERSLETRLAEYRDAMIETRGGLLEAADLVEKTGRLATPLRDGANFYQFVIDDLTKIIEGKELTKFKVEGILTDE